MISVVLAAVVLAAVVLAASVAKAVSINNKMAA